MLEGGGQDVTHAFGVFQNPSGSQRDAGQRIVGYDNEAGKGDHRHYRDREEPYTLTSLEQLVADFEADVRKEIANE